MATTKFDVCIVGSGPGGGIAAYALAKAGLKVALVESGGRLRPGIDFNSHGSVYEHLEKRLAAHRGPLMSVTDLAERNHFTPVGDRPGHGLLRALGGRSLCWAGHSLRFGPLDFRSWPITYVQVAPYYSRAERFMSVYGNRDGLWNMPDGEFLKPVPMRCGEQMLRKGVQKLRQSGRKIELIGLRKAMPTQRVPDRVPCHYCGHCMAGCEVDAKYTSANTPVRLALPTGNLTLFTNAMMTRIVMSDPRHVAGIEYVREGRTEEIRCRALVLACSTIETARLLLATKSADNPQGLANSSGQVGRNLTSHFGVSVTGLFPQLHGRDGSNDDGTDYYHALITGLYWDKASPNFESTYQIQCGSGLHPLSLNIRSVPGFGSTLKRELRELNNIHASLGMQGAIQPSADTFIDLDPDRQDKYGLPLPRVHLKYGTNEVAMASDMVATAEEVIRAAGGRVYLSPGEITASKLHLDYNHWVGSTRMGKDARNSVVDANSRCHDVNNLFIGDSSVFTTYPEKNPTLTNIALSWRMADRLAESFRRGELT